MCSWLFEFPWNIDSTRDGAIRIIRTNQIETKTVNSNGNAHESCKVIGMRILLNLECLRCMYLLLCWMELVFHFLYMQIGWGFSMECHNSIATTINLWLNICQCPCWFRFKWIFKCICICDLSILFSIPYLMCVCVCLTPFHFTTFRFAHLSISHMLANWSVCAIQFLLKQRIFHTG